MLLLHYIGSFKLSTLSWMSWSQSAIERYVAGTIRLVDLLGYVLVDLAA